jgi:uncharacterized membrane protein YdjX (TVP38/TMEM64 family)
MPQENISAQKGKRMINASFLKSNTFKALLFVFVLILFFAIGRYVTFDKEAFKAFFGNFPLGLSALIFIVSYVTLTFFIWLGPKDILRIVAAIIYGPYLSTALVWTGEMLNAAILFSLSRKLGRGFVESRIKGGFKRLDEAIAGKSFWGVFWLRFFPIVPFRFLDLGFGLTGISLKKYLSIAFLSSPLRIFIVQLFLSVGVETILDPERLALYFESHPIVAVLCYGYLGGAVIAMLIWKARVKKSNPK